MTDNVQTDSVDAAVDNLTITNDGKGDDFVDPWNVASSSDTGVDYDKLISMIARH